MEELINLDLEETLKDDREGAVRDEICEQFQQKADQIQTAIKGGAPQGLYQRLERQYAGYLAAVETIRAYWAQMHGRAP